MSTETDPILPVEELQDIAVAACNGEQKALLLGGLVAGHAYTYSDARRLILEPQGDNPVWPISRNGAGSYFCDTFPHIGLVTKITAAANNIDTYMLTERGHEIGVPLAGHLLQKSYDGGPPLIAYFGPASAYTDLGIRNSTRRVRMMRILLERDGAVIRLADLAALMYMEVNHTGQVSDDLATGQLLSKETHGSGKPLVEYSAAPSLATHHMRSNASPESHAVVQILQQYFAENPEGRITTDIILEQLRKIDAYKNADLVQLRESIQTTVWGLRNRRAQAHLIAHELVATDRGREPVWADAEQLGHMRDVITILDRTNNRSEDTYREEGRERARALRASIQAARILLEKARDSSIALKGLPEGKAKIRTAITGVIAGSAVPMPVRTVQEALLDNGINLDMATVRNHLDNLTEEGAFAKLEEATGSLYALVPENE